MSFDEPVEVKNWKRERVLGSGGFGTVTLWKQKNGNQMIALKKCRCGADSLLTSKQKERWKKEVEIMQRLEHPNVVRALPLPEDLSKLPSVLPMLCMEYCSKGDLRQVLNKPENCCGLQDSDVRQLIKNVSCAVSYLHSEKITHRDLKPENIVLSQDDSGVIYKLIDLGYAKELDQSSCTSFVGTLQYLAPELFLNKKYSSSVDYWSLGLVSHEVITGLRPFLPNMAPVTWMKHVREKAPEHICASQTQNGKIEFSSHLFPQNHISSVLQKEMERWLRLVLDYDPKRRGRNSDGEVVVFSEIESVLAKKIIQVFSMITYEKLSYTVEDSTPFSQIQEQIECDTKIPVKDQELMLASGQQIDLNAIVGQYFRGTYQEVLYVSKRGSLGLPTVPPNLPELVASILQYPREKMEYVFQRRAYSHAVFFLQQENKLYKSFLVGCRLKLLSTILGCQKLNREMQRITDLYHGVAALRELCMDAYKFDTVQAKKAKLNSVLSNWQQQIEFIDKKYIELHDKTQLLTSETQKMTKVARKLQTAHPNKIKEDSTLSSLLDTGLEVYDKLRRRPTSERSTPQDSLDMVKVLYNFLKQRDCLLHDQIFNGHLKQLIDCEQNLTKFMPKLEDATSKLDSLKLEIIAANRERQRSVWEMLSASVGDGKFSPSSIPFPPSTFFPNSGNRIPFLFRSHSSRSLYTEDHPPPVPPHGIASSVMTFSAQSLFTPSSPSISQSNLQNPIRTSGPVFDVTDQQQALKGSHISNGNDSGIASGWAKTSVKGSTFSLRNQSLVDDDRTVSMINENISLRVQTQELMENLSHFRKVLNEESSSMDWSFLKIDS